MQLRGAAFIGIDNFLQLGEQIQTVAGDHQDIANLLQHRVIQAETAGDSLIPAPLAQVIHPDVMGKTRFVRRLPYLIRFLSAVSKQVDGIGKQAVDLLFPRLLYGKQRFKGAQRWE
ncbi:Uncharacterised protein [Leclercia adecarboxylata]|uniref:Uncharacterized protein n=1 Tax=Leclercia adecarboxylata TaxID=83655 RepID=A0A4U9HV97_9ENTR|nr:Uncharacterised protein [Leclercia adecarboxylata]